MKGVSNKQFNTSRMPGQPVGGAAQATATAQVKGPGKAAKTKRKARVLTAADLATINRRLDQCLPMETPEWQRVEQLLMQLSEFAPNSLVYEAGIAVALYADDQAHRAYMLGVEDGEERAETAAKAAKPTIGAA